MRRSRVGIDWRNREWWWERAAADGDLSKPVATCVRELRRKKGRRFVA
jgi:hypothetical protein